VQAGHGRDPGQLFDLRGAWRLQAAEILGARGHLGRAASTCGLCRPLDTETVIASVKKTNRIVTVEECWPVCGIASEIATQVMEHAFDWLDAPPARVTGKDVPMPYAANLEKLALPSVEEVVAAVKAVCYRSSRP
jgi:pyruvate dehydrogenase E1 component beta subunit